MIKINLATRKVPAGSEPSSGGKGVFSKVDVGGFKDLPIRKIAVPIIACFVASYVSDYYRQEEMAQAELKVKKVQEEFDRIKKELDSYADYERKKKELEEDERVIQVKIDTIQKLVEDRQTPPKVLRGLSGSIPQDVWLSEFSIRNADVSLRGSAMDFNQISDFMKKLTDTALFADLLLEGSNQAKDEKGQPVAHFQLKGKRK